MKQATICFPIKGSRILLGMKKYRPGGHNVGVGKWNGFGGRVEPDETIENAVRRELQEESGLIAEEKDFENVAHIIFKNGDGTEFDGTIFLVRSWEGSAVESDEMKPQWFEIANIPYDAMWSADRQWLPLILAGKKIDATIIFKAGTDAVESFTHTERAV